VTCKDIKRVQERDKDLDAQLLKFLCLQQTKRVDLGG
jgi:hypothetical protein